MFLQHTNIHIKNNIIHPTARQDDNIALSSVLYLYLVLLVVVVVVVILVIILFDMFDVFNVFDMFDVVLSLSTGALITCITKHISNKFNAIILFIKCILQNYK